MHQANFGHSNKMALPFTTSVDANPLQALLTLTTTEEPFVWTRDDAPVTYTAPTEDAEDTFVFTNYPARVCVALACFTVFVVGTVGNSLTILAVLVTRKLQNSTNTFVVNLAVSDLLSCIFLPWTIVGLLIRGDWPAELTVACTIAGGMLPLSLGCSFYTLASIALERLILITYPRHTYHRVFSPRVLALWVAIIWIIPFSFVILPPLVGVGALGFNPKYRTCSDISEGYHPNASQTFDYIQAAGVFPVPLLILIVSYTRIIYFVWSHSKNLVTREIPMAVTKTPLPTDSPSTSSGDGTKPTAPKPRKISISVAAASEDSLNQSYGSDSSSALRKVKKMSRRELRVTKNLFIIFCAFMICLFPYILCLIFDDSDYFIPVTFSLLIINSCINPVIYAVRFPNFKLIFGHMVRCRWYAIPEPSGFLRAVRCDSCACCTAQFA